MALTFGRGINIGRGVQATPNFVVIPDNLTTYLDAGNSSSYSGSGSTWTDLIGSDNNATLINTPTFTSAGASSYFTFASASSQRATLAGTPLNVTNYTKSCWFYLNSVTDNNLISYDDGVNTGHYVFFGGTNKMYCGHTSWAGFPNTYPSTANFSTLTWYMMALTFNTTDGMSLYINGVLDSTYTATKTAPVGNGVNLASYGVGNLLNGRLAQVLLYNRSLTSTEVLQNFQATRSRYGV